MNLLLKIKQLLNLLKTYCTTEVEYQIKHPTKELDDIQFLFESRYYNGAEGPIIVKIPRNKTIKSISYKVNFEINEYPITIIASSAKDLELSVVDVLNLYQEILRSQGKREAMCTGNPEKYFIRYTHNNTIYQQIVKPNGTIRLGEKTVITITDMFK